MFKDNEGKDDQNKECYNGYEELDVEGEYEETRAMVRTFSV